ncbi:MAG TPA: GC-type dockerin domain-anchored protein, partial [Phycisphaerales bacterium]|nr:GC-type dockerin domain-anchored protein [Phycisphaerales bacterium]
SFDNEELPGAAFVFNVGACLCAADFGGDGVVNTMDVAAFLNAWVADHPGADVLRDGSVDTRDVAAFLNLWVAGC